MRVRNLLESRYLTRVLPRELELTRLESLRRCVVSAAAATIPSSCSARARSLRAWPARWSCPSC